MWSLVTIFSLAQCRAMDVFHCPFSHFILYIPVKPVVQVSFTVSPSLYDSFATGSVFSWGICSRLHTEKQKQMLHKEVTVIMY